MDVKKLKEAIEVMALLESEPKSKQSDEADDFEGKIVISILQRGWVFVGRYHRKGEYIVLDPVANYRYQGSGKGFGYTAEEGPTSDCKIDKCYKPVRYHYLTEVGAVLCEESKWIKALS